MVVAKCIRKVGSSKSPDKSKARIDSNVLNKINLQAVHTAGRLKFYIHLELRLRQDCGNFLFLSDHLDSNQKTLLLLENMFYDF